MSRPQAGPCGMKDLDENCAPVTIRRIGQTGRRGWSSCQATGSLNGTHNNKNNCGHPSREPSQEQPMDKSGVLPVDEAGTQQGDSRVIAS